jgi:hypothetical protein
MIAQTASVACNRGGGAISIGSTSIFGNDQITNAVRPA